MIKKQNDEVILPLAQPWITTYPIFANPLSIIQLEKESHPWILSSFLQLVCYGNEALSFYDFNYRTCPYLTVQRICKDFLYKSHIDLISFLKLVLSRQQYVYLIVNTKCISCYNVDSSYSRHDMFIYGYNESRKVFYIADNYVNGKYSKGECKYDELIAAINTLEEKDEGYLGMNGCIEFMSYNNDKFYNRFYCDINLTRIKDSLKAYLESKSFNMWSVQDFRALTYGEKKFTFGIDCYSFLHKSIMKMERQEAIPFPSFYAIYNHKMHLFRVVQFLHDMKYISNGEKHLKNLNELCEIAKININLIIKYRLSTKNFLIDKIHYAYDKMEKMEKIMIREIINDIIG